MEAFCHIFDTSRMQNGTFLPLDQVRHLNPQPSPYGDKYFCCGLPYESEGCSRLNYHVHNQIQRQSLVFEFKRTPTPQGPTDERSMKVYSLDCEMVYTTGGCEIARVVMVDWKGDLVFDRLCRPENEIVDHNTLFSGITKEMMAGVKMSLCDV
uniref:Exonuclease domain-containing protein n=1 Tax=Bursaphelenchus xylophilus TaxID=6326 RepID=A0A1I7SNP0_BURXY